MIPRAGRRAQLATTAVDPLASPLRLNAPSQPEAGGAVVPPPQPIPSALSWLDDEPPPSASAASATTSAASTQVMPAPSSAPFAAEAPRAVEPAPIAPPLPAPLTAPAAAIVEVYSDGATSIAALEREAAQLDSSLAACQASCDNLEKAQADASGELANLTAQLEFARRQRSSLVESRAEHKRNMDQRAQNVRQRTSLTLSELRLALSSSADEAAASDCERMRKEIELTSGRVAQLELELEEAMKSHNESPPELTAGAQLADGVRSLMRNLRQEFNLNVKSMVAAEVRNALQEAHSRAIEENVRRTKERALALDDHRTGRARAFDQFRQARKKDRQELAEGIIADVRVHFRRRLEEKRSKGAVAIREQEIRLERDAQQARQDATVAIERVAARFAADVASLEKACLDREADLRQRQDNERLHTRKVLEIELETLQRTLQQEVDFTSRRSAAVVTDIQGSHSFVDVSASLLERVRKTNDDVKFALASAVSLTSEGSSETRRLVQEREAVVKEMQSYTASQKESLDRDRARLQSVFTLLEQRCTQLEAGMRQGRSSLAASQQQVEQTRAVWARGLRAHVEESGRPLPSVLDCVVDVLFEISVKLRELQSKAKSLTAVRRTHYRQQQVSEEQVNVRQEETSKKVVGILSLYEQVSRLFGDVDAKQRYWTSEKRELDNAKLRLNQDMQTFNEAAELLRNMSEKLQRESASVKENMRSSAAAQRGLLVPKESRLYSTGNAGQHAAARDRRSDSALHSRRPVDDTVLSKMSQSRYHHLYAAQTPAGHNTELFESLVKVPTDMSGQSADFGQGNDSYRHPSGSDRIESGESNCGNPNRRLVEREGSLPAAANRGSSSESLPQARHSLTTPSTES